MGSREPGILVVVVAYGRDDYLDNCLRTLEAGDPVVVVDNGQSDRAREICEELGAHYLRSSGNRGYAAGVNMALRAYRTLGMDVLLLNPDASLPWVDVKTMQREMYRDCDIAAVGPRLVGTDGSEQKAEWPMPSPLVAVAAVVGKADYLTVRRFVTGAVLLLRGQAVDELGGFDERFFLYAEETDWQMRMMRAGWRAAVVSSATAVHVSGGTSSDPKRRLVEFNASAERYIRKWYGQLGWQVFRVASILTATRRLVAGRSDTRALQRLVIAQYLLGPTRFAERRYEN